MKTEASLWKRINKTFTVHTEPEESKNANNHPLFCICVWEKLGQENHTKAILPIHQIPWVYTFLKETWESPRANKIWPRGVWTHDLRIRSSDTLL